MSAPALAYLTDVEGSLARLHSFAAGNPLVRLDEAGRLIVAPGAVFVFGGDAVDRGPGARRVVATLLEVKRRQPDQVVLLAGNRDINKLRLPRELGGEPPVRTPDDVRRGPRPELLRWIFTHTMGAPAAFDHRATELAAERGAAPSGDDVVDSFVAELEPAGVMTAYLAAAQLAFRAGPTLFVHGGLSSASLGAVPGRLAPPAHPEDLDLDGWIAALNHWYAEQVDAFVQRRLDAGQPAWQALVAYQAPLPGSRQNPGSVVYGRSADEHNNLILPDEGVTRALAASGVSRAVVGHTPSGDSPSIARGRGLTLVCADNSHATHAEASRVYVVDDVLGIDAATRLDGDPEGGALHRVRFELRGGDGARSDGAGTTTPVGLRLRRGGALVRGALADGAWLTYRALPGWKNEQRAVADAELGREELEEPV